MKTNIVEKYLKCSMLVMFKEENKWRKELLKEERPKKDRMKEISIYINLTGFLLDILNNEKGL